MAERVYEGMFLLDSNKYARDSAGISNGINEMIEKCGGEVLVSRLWSEQKLAYPINGQRKGTYWLSYFRMNTGKLTELNRAARLNVNVLRDLVITVDDRLVDTLVSHATGESKTEETGESIVTTATATATETAATETATTAATETAATETAATAEKATTETTAETATAEKATTETTAETETAETETAEKATTETTAEAEKAEGGV